MIKFLRRNIGCWEVCADVDRHHLPIPILEFTDETEMFNYIKAVLPFTADESEYKLRTHKNVVIHWTVMGYIT